MNMEQLCSELHKELDKGGLASTEVDVNKVQKLLESYSANSTDWQKYAYFDEKRYTRNLVDDGNGFFNLMILCWAPGTQSAIHDHNNSHCLLKVLDGTVEESLYDWPTSCDSALSLSPYGDGDGDVCNSEQKSVGIHLKKTCPYTPNQVTYMHDKIGLHRIANPSTKGAVTLHLYSPPYSTCKTFCEKTGIARPSGNIVFYSINGEKEKFMEEIYEKLNQKLSPCLLNSTSSLNSNSHSPSLKPAMLQNSCRKIGA